MHCPAGAVVIVVVEVVLDDDELVVLEDDEVVVAHSTRPAPVPEHTQVAVFPL